MEDRNQPVFHLTEEQWDALEAAEKSAKALRWPWEREDEYAPPRRLLDGEERYWPDWAFGR